MSCVQRGVVYRVSLGIVDSFVFEISKLLVTVFDEMEYREAKRESLKAARKRTSASLKPSRELSPDGYEFQNEPSESA
jgi:phage regulator Rha-like protein